MADANGAIEESGHVPSDVTKLSNIVDEQSKVLQRLLNEVTTLRSNISNEAQPKSPTLPTGHTTPARSIWESQIGTYHLNEDTNGLLKSFVWRKGLTIQQLLAPQRPWNSWQYRLSYPRLSAFLQGAPLDESSRSQVICEDLNERGKVSRWESKHGILDQESLWHSISTRTEPRRSTVSFVSVNGRTEPEEILAALSRNLRVLDLSPMVAVMILGATPRINLSNTAPFLERHLSFCNWGKAVLFGMKSPGGQSRLNSFTFEYHFAFYFVPKGAMDPELAVKDFRNLRRSSAFGPNLSERSPWIYEEQLSFLLMGQGTDVYTCYQLAERYFRGPYIQGTGQGSLFINPDRGGWTPCAMFLNWILLALHHVRFRWQSAIEAVDMQIVSPSDIIFSEDDPDLLSDDPQFSRNKTYFWALQAYKMFDERLEETISTWTDFRESSLDKLNDGRMPENTWDFTVASIDLGIDRLKSKLDHVRVKSHEVQNLRDGLFGASALFDSRTTVRQGDNIRLLTYITLLFLPLSFCTSIFGMQVILPTLPIKVFIITVPSIFVFTALLVFNLQNIIETWQYAASVLTTKLRRSMRQTQSGRWVGTARALQYDKLTNEPPIRRHSRLSTHWSYVVYGVEGIAVHLPVHEVNWLLLSIRTMTESIFAKGDPSVIKELSNIEVGGENITTDISRAARVRAVKVAQIRHVEEDKKILIRATRFVLLLLRILCLPIAVITVTIEYLILLPLSVTHPARPLDWLGLHLTSEPPPAAGMSTGSHGSSLAAAGRDKLGQQEHERARKMTIVSIAGSDNIFQPHELHPSRKRWRKVATFRESGALKNEEIELAEPRFRSDIFGSVPQ